MYIHESRSRGGLLASVWPTFLVSIKLDPEDCSQSWDHNWNISWDKFPFASARIIAMHFNVSDSTVHDILSRELGPRKFSRRWAPYQLSEPQKKVRVSTSIELLSLLNQYSGLQFEGIATGDEPWVCHLIESDQMFVCRREEVIPRFRSRFSIKKAMITVFVTMQQ
jgi:hypothetical protein